MHDGLAPPAKRVVRRGGAALKWEQSDIAVLRSLVLAYGVGNWVEKAKVDTFVDKQRTPKSLESAYYKYISKGL